MLNRKKLFHIAIAILCASLVIALAMGYFSGVKRDSYNVVEIYIFNWDKNATVLDDNIDVQFRISIDSNDDGIYDIVGNSIVFQNTSVEIVPFKLGDVIQTTNSEFKFKVEVFRVVNGSVVSMHYQENGLTPVNSGLNKVDSSQVWTYDATSVIGKDDLACRISYVYYVTFSS